MSARTQQLARAWIVWQTFIVRGASANDLETFIFAFGMDRHARVKV